VTFILGTSLSIAYLIFALATQSTIALPSITLFFTNIYGMLSAIRFLYMMLNNSITIINNQNNSITIINFDEISNMDLQTLRLFFILGCISVAYGCLVAMANKFKKEVDHSKITAA
jgi:hypothetical protein